MSENSKNQRRKYSHEFKLEAIRRTDLGKNVAEVARELEIPVHQLYKWRAELDHKQSEAFPGKGHATPNAEIETLRKENKRLREERDILKKAWASLPGTQHSVPIHQRIRTAISGEGDV